MAYQVQLKVCGWRPSRRRLTVTRGKHARERAGAGATLYKPVNKQPWVCHALWLTGPASVAGVSSLGALTLSALVVLSQGKQNSFSQSQDSISTENSMLWFHWLMKMYRGSPLSMVSLKGQIKPKAGLAHRRFSQKTNERIWFVCYEKQKRKQNKFVCSFFGRIYGAPILLSVLSDL